VTVKTQLYQHRKINTDYSNQLELSCDSAIIIIITIIKHTPKIGAKRL